MSKGTKLALGIGGGYVAIGAGLWGAAKVFPSLRGKIPYIYDPGTFIPSWPVQLLKTFFSSATGPTDKG